MKIEPSKIYHIYNRANARLNLFREARNYAFFIKRYRQYISPLVKTHGWCLMPNHFHFLIHVKSNAEILANINNKLKEKLTIEDEEKICSKYISQKFSNLFNSYAKSYNRAYNNKGNLFNQNFKGKELEDEDSLMRVLLYIHNNPVKHGFTQNISDWEYSSYHAYLNEDYTILERGALNGMFYNHDNFVLIHSRAGLLDSGLNLEFEDE